MLFIIPNTGSEMFNIVDSRQYHRLKSRYLQGISVNIPFTKLCQKIKKYLIIRRTVNFIRDQNDLFIRSGAQFSERLK